MVAFSPLAALLFALAWQAYSPTKQ